MVATLNRLGQRRSYQWRRDHQYGQYRPAENAIVVYNGDLPVRGAIPCVYQHGVLGSPFTTHLARVVKSLAGIIDAGHPVLLADYSGGSGWGQNDIVDPSGSIDDVLTWAAATYFVRTDQVIMAGESAGSIGAQVWASRRPSQTAAVYCVAPIPSLASFYTANPSLQGAIDTAYGGHPTYLTELPTHDPGASAVQLALSNATGRIRFEYMLDDELIDPQLVLTHSAAIGALAVGHHGTHADAYAAVRPRDVAHWLDDVLN
jgi:pimeloyl-ACP methyl ester carboxylesterase